MRIALLLTAFALAGACGANGQPGGGGASRAEAGPAVGRDFQVGGFDRINLAGPPDVRVTVGGQPSVRAEGAAADLERLEIAVVDGELRIGTRPGRWTFQRDIVIHVTVPSLRAAAVAGPGGIAIDRVQGRRFAAAVSGPGDLTLGELRVGEASFAVTGPGAIRAAGGAERAEATLTGPGDLRLASFEAGDASVSLHGPGDIDLRATGTVAISMTGPGDVTITGTARCTIARSGPGEVRCPTTG